MSKKDKKKEINALFKEYAETGDLAIREKLITEHLYIAEILAKKYVNRGIEYDDLFQVASIGLINAIDRFDYKKGYAFTSFATPTIVGEIKRYFRDKGWVIRVPRRIQELSKKVNIAKNYLSQNLQEQPTVADIAEYLRISEEEVLEAMEASKVYAPQSLDKTYEFNNEDRDINLGDLIGVEDKNFDNIEIQDLIERTMENLNELENKILVYRYFDKKTQISIAKKLNISQMTVSRVEKKIVRKFREQLGLPT